MMRCLLVRSFTHFIEVAKDYRQPVPFEKKKMITEKNQLEDIEDPVMRRVYSQLAFLTEEMSLTSREQKQWFFRLRREEKELEKQQNIQKKINAKKALKKMIRQLKIPQMKRLGTLYFFTFRGY